MAKLGKWSTGIGDGKAKKSPYVDSNKGYDARSGVDMNQDLNMSMKKGGTATGKAVLTSTKRTKNAGNK